MVIIMKETGFAVKGKVTAISRLMMAVSIEDCGLMVKEVDLGSINTKIMINLKVNGLITKKMEKVKCVMPMETFIKEIGNKI